MSEKTVELGNARLGEQRSVMETIVKDAVCPFCLEHLRKYHKKPLLTENDSWYSRRINGRTKERRFISPNP